MHFRLGELTDTARPFGATHRIAIWPADEVALALRGLPLSGATR